MMKVKVAEVGAALRPSEIVVAVKTLTGTENVVIDRRSLRGGGIFVGNPIRREENNVLVELPREAQSGVWRIWVDSSQLVPEEERMRA